MTVICGAIYGFTVLGVSQGLFNNKANGSQLERDGKAVASQLVGQQVPEAAPGTTDPWFHFRPSAGEYDMQATGGTNLGPENPDLVAAIEGYRAAIAKRENVDPADVPADAVTASASGIDRNISPEYAAIQVARVAAANGLSEAEVQGLVDQNTSKRTLGFLGVPTVNVVTLNLDLAAETANPTTPSPQ